MVIQLTTGVMAAMAVGVAAGLVGGAWLVAKRKRGKGDGPYERVSYENLIAFAQTCKSQYPQALKSRVVCEKADDGTFRITQLILDDTLTAIRSDKGDVVGRIFTCRRIDDKMANRCGNKYPADFDMTI